MKTRIIILTTLITIFGFVFLGQSNLNANEVGVLSNEMPSSSYMNSENSSAQKQGYLYNMNTSSRTMPALTMLKQGMRGVDGGAWDDEDLPGSGSGGGTWGGNQGGPIGDVTPVVIVLLLLMYFVFRGVTTSKRRNNL